MIKELSYCKFVPEGLLPLFLIDFLLIFDHRGFHRECLLFLHFFHLFFFLPSFFLLSFLNETLFEYALFNDFGVLFAVILCLLCIQLQDILIILPLQCGTNGLFLSCLQLQSLLKCKRQFLEYAVTMRHII